MRRQQNDRPASLTIAIENRGRVIVACRNLFDKTAQGEQHSLQGLIGFRFRKEDDEIDRMPLGHRHADLTVTLEPADARPMARTGIDDDDRRFCGIDAIVPAVSINFGDPEQGVIGRTLELPRIQQGFVFEIQQRRHASPVMRDHIVGPLAQRIQKQHRAFPKIAPVGKRIGWDGRADTPLTGGFCICGDQRFHRRDDVHAMVLLAKKFQVGTKITAMYQP